MKREAIQWARRPTGLEFLAFRNGATQLHWGYLSIYLDYRSPCRRWLPKIVRTRLTSYWEVFLFLVVRGNRFSAWPRTDDDEWNCR